MTTELNGLGSATYSNASAVIDNTSALYQYMWLELYLASLTPAAGQYVSVYMVASLDGTNYADGGGSTAPANCSFLCSFDLSTSAGTKRRVTNFPIQVPPLKFSLIVYNSGTTAFAGTGNTLKYSLGYEQAA